MSRVGTKRRCWTKSEDAVLRDYWPRGGLAAVGGRLPGRSDQAIRSRATWLKVGVAPANVIRKAPRSKGDDVSTRDIAFWLATAVLSARPSVPSRDHIMERWGVNRSTAYRWRRWAQDRLEQIQAREGDGHAD